MKKKLQKISCWIVSCIMIFTQAVVLSNKVYADSTNLALGKPITANCNTQTYVATNANDGNVNTYWEGASNSYPNTLTVDLQGTDTINKIVLKLNPNSIWTERTQALSVLTSTDDVTYNTIVSASNYTFDPSSGNTVTISFEDTKARYVRLNFTANSGATGGQVGEFEVYGTADNSGTQSGNKYEGEAAVLSGGAKVNVDHTGYSGTGFVDGIQTVGADVYFNVNVQTAGYYDVDLRYGNSMGSTMTESIYVNNTKIRQAALPNLSSWNTWGDKVDTLYLNAGNNSIAYKYDSTDTGNINIDYITINPTQVSSPDLIVTDVNWSPASPNEEDDVTFSAIVKNIGTAATMDGTINSVEFDVDGTIVDTSSYYKSSIPVGGTATITASSKWSATQGNHTVKAVVDSKNNIAEIDENNNSLSKNITVSPLPGCDLVVTDISWSPENPTAGDKVTLSATIKNIGTIATPSVKHEVEFSIDGAPASFYSDSYSSSLAPGASVTLTAGSGNWTAVDGSHSITAYVDYDNFINESRENNNALTKNVFVGRGAEIPWIEYEAEKGTTNGTVLLPNRNVGDLAGEASGRQAVKLTEKGQYVEWTSLKEANSIVVRNCIPDAQNGGGTTATISLYVNGEFRQRLTLSSKNSWLYGSESQPTNNPSDGSPRRIYDEAQALTGDIPEGSKVRLQVDSSDTAAYYGIDFIDLEEVAPAKTMPNGYLSITDFGAVPGSTQDCSNAITQCMNAVAQGKGKGVWIPVGTFYQTNKIIAQSNVTIQGAGMWYSKLYCPDTNQSDWGNIGFNLNGANNFKVYDLALFGEGAIRDTGGKAFCNTPGTGAEFGDIWIEHTNCGFWCGSPSTASGINIYGWRIRDTFADGINLCNSTNNTTIQNCTARTTGDDSFAIWSATDMSSAPCQNNVIRNCSAQLTWRANGFAIYGGANNTIENCTAADTLTYAGVNISSCFKPVPFSGTTTVENVTLTRCGGAFWNGIQFGALWIYAVDSPLNGIKINNIDINDSTYAGLVFQSETYNYPNPAPINNVSLSNININNSGTDGIWVKPGTIGSATLSDVHVTNSTGLPLRNDANSTFTINKSTGNSGW